MDPFLSCLNYLFIPKPPALGAQSLSHWTTRGVPGFFLINFYWSIIALQRCVSFCCTAKWISYMFIYIYVLFFGFPSHVVSSPLSCEKFPMSYNSLLLNHFAHSVIAYIWQSKLQVHPTLSPFFFPWYPYVCSLHLCLYFCFENKIIYTIFLGSTVLLFLTSSPCMTVCMSSHISAKSQFCSFKMAGFLGKIGEYFPYSSA